MINELKQQLPDSTGAQRQVWAKQIVENELSIQDLAVLLSHEHKIASRFLWLLTDIALVNEAMVQKELVFLFDVCSNLEHIEIEASFANYWLICGIPEEREAEWINCLFKWLRSPQTNVTTKSRALFTLFNATEKHADLKNELKLVIEEQLDLNTENFKKRASKILEQL